MTSEITVYKANQRRKTGVFEVLRIFTVDVVNGRELIWQLFKRDFLMQYKKSFLGIGWILLSPLIGFASWVFMNAAGVLNPGEMDFPYPAFVLISTIMWGFFTSSVIAASKTLRAGQGFIGQVYYPHHTMLVKELCQAYINFLISFMFITLLLIAFDVPLSIFYYATPLLVLPMMFLAAAIGLTLAIVNVVSKDVEKAIGYLLNFFMFLTPVVYTADKKTGLVKLVLTCNPMTYLHGCARDLVVFGNSRSLDVFVYLTLAALLFLLLSMKWYYVAEEKVIEKMI